MQHFTPYFDNIFLLYKMLAEYTTFSVYANGWRCKCTRCSSFIKIESKKKRIVELLGCLTLVQCEFLFLILLYDNIYRYMRVARGTCSFVSIEFMGNVFTLCCIIYGWCVGLLSVSCATTIYTFCYGYLLCSAGTTTICTKILSASLGVPNDFARGWNY